MVSTYPASLPAATAIDEPANRLLVHPLADRLLPFAIRMRIPPNAISLAGLGFGVIAAIAYYRWDEPAFVIVGLIAMTCWHVMDGLDGRVARATGRTTAFGRFLDGVCDYGVFILVYVSLWLSAGPELGMTFSFFLAASAGAAHAVQSAWYEARRVTYLRRLNGLPGPVRPDIVGGWLERTYNNFEARLLASDRAVDDWLEAGGSRAAYVSALLPVQRLATIEGQTARTIAIAAACLAGSPAWFWLWELVALSLALALLERERRRREKQLTG